MGAEFPSSPAMMLTYSACRLATITTLLKLCAGTQDPYTGSTDPYTQSPGGTPSNPRNTHDNSLSDAIHDLQKTVSRLSEENRLNSEEIFTRFKYTEDQLVTMQSSIEALRTEQIQRSEYIHSELSYLTGRDQSAGIFNVTSSTQKIINGIDQKFKEQIRVIDGHSSKQCKKFENSLSRCGVIENVVKTMVNPVKTDTVIKTDPGNPNPVLPEPISGKDEDASAGEFVGPGAVNDNTLKTTQKFVKKAATSNCKFGKVANAAQLINGEQLDSRTTVSQPHEWTRSKEFSGQPGIGYTHEMLTDTGRKWEYTFNFWKLTGDAEVGICNELSPSVGESWIGNSAKSFAIWNGGNKPQGQVWSKGTLKGSHKNLKFKQGDEITFSYTPCPHGEISILKNGVPIIQPTRFKIRGQAGFRFCVSLAQPGDVVYRSSWALNTAK